MFGTHDFGLFVFTALVLNATPGADFLYTVTRTLQSGLRGGAAAALGISAGCIVHTMAAGLGLAALLATSAIAFSMIKLIGAAYLLWLAYGMLRNAWSGGSAVIESGRAPPASLRTIFVQGFLTNVLNPKVALFFLALLPQFIDTDAPHKALAFLFLSAVFVVNGTVFLFALVAVTARVRRIGTVPRVTRALNAAGGTLFAALAARLALAER